MAERLLLEDLGVSLWRVTQPGVGAWFEVRVRDAGVVMKEPDPDLAAEQWAHERHVQYVIHGDPSAPAPRGLIRKDVPHA